MTSLLPKLSVPDGRRAVVLHADDIGMCQATLSAYAQLVRSSPVRSASVMVPCGWFPAVVRQCREAFSEHDMGVHLTLTSEWQLYRWGPITKAASLCDEEGYFHRDAARVYQLADREAVRRELAAQLKRALAAGLDVTHLDNHMLAVEHPRLGMDYLQLAEQHSLPCFAVPSDLSSSFAGVPREQLARVMPFDDCVELPLDMVGDRLEIAKRALDGLSGQLGYFMCHPAQDTPELRACAPDWAARVADYQLCLDEGFAKLLDALGFHVVSMRAVRKALFETSALGRR